MGGWIFPDICSARQLQPNVFATLVSLRANTSSGTKSPASGPLAFGA
jgi:hypothetical protein